MKKIHLTIFEEDKEYVQKLAVAISQREGERMEIAWYTDWDSYLNTARVYDEGLFLLGEAFWIQEMFVNLSALEKGQIILLSADGVTKELADYPIIRKYSSVDMIVQSVYRYAAEECREDSIWPGCGKQTIGVYAPWNSELSMLFSFVLLQVLAEKERFLYVSFQEGWGRTNGSKDDMGENLADFVSFLRMGKGSAQLRLKSISRKLGKGSCIPPVDNPQNISDMNRGDYRRLWEVLCSQTEYEGVLAEFGSTYEGLYEDMKQCQVIYCPYQEDILLTNRREQLGHILLLHKAEELQNKMQEIKLPRLTCCGGGSWDEEQLVKGLLCSEFGDTVRGLVNGYGS